MFVGADGSNLGDSKSTTQKLSDSTRSGADDTSDSSKGYLQSAQEGLSNAAGSVSDTLGGKLLPSFSTSSQLLITVFAQQTRRTRSPVLPAANSRSFYDTLLVEFPFVSSMA